MFPNQLGGYGDELRRQQRLQAIYQQSMCSPASTFARRQQNLIKRSQPRYQQQYNLPKCAALTRCGPRFLGPRLG